MDFEIKEETIYTIIYIFIYFNPVNFDVCTFILFLFRLLYFIFINMNNNVNC